MTHKGMWRIYSNPDPHGEQGWELWPIIDQGHYTQCLRHWQIFVRAITGLGVMARQTICQCLDHYVYSDLHLWPITLDQGHDTSLDPRQLSCEILFKSTMRIRNYGLDKLWLTPDGQRHNIIHPVWRQAYKYILCNNMAHNTVVTYLFIT
jgi:hypothetical protein